MSSPVARVALLLSGLPRQWQRCLPSQLELLKNWPHDVFFHFWDSILDEKEKAGITGLLKPRAHAFEPQKDFSFVDNDPAIPHDLINVPSRTCSQYYSWGKVADLFEPHKNDYEIVIRARSDLQFIYSLDHIIPALKPNDILIPWWDEKKRLLSDIFAIGGVEPMLYYHRIGEKALDYARTSQFNTELLVTMHFEKRPDIHIYTDSRSYFFVRRPHMDNYTIEQAMAENPGRNKWLDPDIVKAHSEHHERLKGAEGAAHVRNFTKSQLDLMQRETKEKSRN